MPELIVTTLVTALVSSIIGAVVGAVVASANKAKSRHDHETEKDRAQQKAIYNGVKTLLRNELVQMHREWVEEKGYITLEALEYAEDTYTAYHDLNGNGSGTKLWNDMKSLPVKEKP